MTNLLGWFVWGKSSKVRTATHDLPQNPTVQSAMNAAG